MAQWSQGLPLGSTEHCFSFSKNSTSSDTAASSTPKRSPLGCSANCELRFADWGFCSDLDAEAKAAEKGASQGDCATCGDVTRDSKMSIVASGSEPVEGCIRGGGIGEMKLIMRARRGSTACTTPLPDVGSARSPTVESETSRRATRSAIKRA